MSNVTYSLFYEVLVDSRYNTQVINTDNSWNYACGSHITLSKQEYADIGVRFAPSGWESDMVQAGCYGLEFPTMDRAIGLVDNQIEVHKISIPMISRNLE